MKTCPHCYHKNSDTAYTCASCQSPLDSSTPVAKTRARTAAEIILEPGDVIAAKYKIIRQLGQGGMGSVYLVEEIALEKQYALKLISPFHVANPEARLRFKQEVSICREMYHPAIVRVFDFGESELQQGQYYFTMEYLQGKTLGELLRSRQGTLPPFTLEEIRLVMTPLLEALAYAHKYTIHRDIKPDNIMVKGEFPEVEIRILDFGIARTMSVSRFTMTSQELGTALYIAPEQMQGAHGVDARTDIYSVSVVLYEMLTNSNSPGLDLPSDLLPPAYAPFDAMVKKGLAKDPARRYPDAPAMLETLQQTLDRCETTLQQEEEAEKRRIAEEQRKKEKEARKKALAEEEKRRKEEEKKQQERERQQKIKKLESSLENVIGFSQWEKAHGLCRDIQAIDAINPLVRKELPRIERELERQEEDLAREAARKKAEAEAEKPRQDEARKKALAEAEKRRQEAEKKQQDIKIPQVDPEEFIEEGVSSSKKLFVALAVAVLIPVGYFALFHKSGPVPIQKSEKPLNNHEPSATYTDPTTGMEFVFVKGGCFQMGDTFGDGNVYGKPVHEVCVNDFYMGKYEVTQEAWQNIMGNNPSEYKKGDNYPVERVSWNDTQEFIRKLNTKSHRKYRLPTEAEWEYAARSGGRKEKYAGGNNVDIVAWYSKNSGRQTHEVGTKQANGLGIYDMSGNVEEWCSDKWDSDYYKTSPRNNPQGPSSGSYRVSRGGSWFNAPRVVRAAYRFREAPAFRSGILGFRLLFREGSR